LDAFGLFSYDLPLNRAWIGWFLVPVTKAGENEVVVDLLFFSVAEIERFRLFGN
jgi:hypothetical protein